MDRDRTLPTWPNLLQLLLEHFSDALLSSRRGEGRGLLLLLFFFLGLTGSVLTGSRLPCGLIGLLGSPGPIKGLLGPF